jgi:hypothetical protein
MDEAFINIIIENIGVQRERERERDLLFNVLDDESII